MNLPDLPIPGRVNNRAMKLAQPPKLIPGAERDGTYFSGHTLKLPLTNVEYSPDFLRVKQVAHTRSPKCQEVQEVSLPILKRFYKRKGRRADREAFRKMQ